MRGPRSVAHTAARIDEPGEHPPTLLRDWAIGCGHHACRWIYETRNSVLSLSTVRQFDLIDATRRAPPDFQLVNNANNAFSTEYSLFTV